MIITTKIKTDFEGGSGFFPRVYPRPASIPKLSSSFFYEI